MITRDALLLEYRAFLASIDPNVYPTFNFGYPVSTEVGQGSLVHFFNCLQRGVHGRAWYKRNTDQGDIVLPASAMPVDDARINSLMAMIVRGLFMHEFGFALQKNWDAKVTMFEADVEANIMNQAKRLLGPNPVFVTRNFGRGTFVYEGGNISIMRNLSVWQFTLFGGLLLADDTLALSRFSALTSRNDDVQGPLGDDELSI